jgi:hypothetical protein
MMKATGLALIFTFIIYVSTGLLSIHLFGSSIQSNVLVNVANEGNNFLSLAVRVAFACVIACHVPYVFYYGKEGCSIVADELLNGSTSKQLSAKKRADYSNGE